MNCIKKYYTHLYKYDLNYKKKVNSIQELSLKAYIKIIFSTNYEIILCNLNNFQNINFEMNPPVKHFYIKPLLLISKV